MGATTSLEALAMVCEAVEMSYSEELSELERKLVNWSIIKDYRMVLHYKCLNGQVSYNKRRKNKNTSLTAAYQSL